MKKFDVAAMILRMNPDELVKYFSDIRGFYFIRNNKII